MRQLPLLQDHATSKPLSGLDPTSQIFVEGMPGGRGIFNNRTDQGKVKCAAGVDGCSMEGPVDEANDLTGLFTDVINIQIPRELVGKNNAKEFCRRNTFNRLIVESKSNIREGINLGRDDHELGLRGIGSELIQAKPIMNGIDIRLKNNQIRRSSDGFEEGGVLCIEN